MAFMKSKLLTFLTRWSGPHYSTTVKLETFYVIARNRAPGSAGCKTSNLANAPRKLVDVLEIHGQFLNDPNTSQGPFSQGALPDNWPAIERVHLAAPQRRRGHVVTVAQFHY